MHILIQQFLKHTHMDLNCESCYYDIRDFNE